MALSYYIVYKPFGVLSQFSGEGNTLGMLSDFPSDVYPVGRLDKDSEGLLLLTNDTRLNHLLLDPNYSHERTYWVQVEGEITDQALKDLESGVEISVNKKIHKTLKAKAERLKDVARLLPERDPPIRFRKNVPDSWIAITLKEGKNRQVRKMTAAVGFPTLRLVRWSLEGLSIKGFGVGDVRLLDGTTLYPTLGISGKGQTSEGIKKPQYQKTKKKKRY
ncbi:pseudouridine synthase [Cyclobacterium qasimii]|uniref:Pseudouridine synthase n=2 Tax=Cyclobacterium qasimii TaxID=1350429 RepID=S7WHI5_9BACT|nr:pseudouridine synthase [Cyclobacterium qasimii]EPR66189.1 Ribosomal large subunit pseudouridine synthase E [Cyclobacterium qasimii M12-11B]GEO21291.1 pseudouridine synthase [Cyclobacterium qasimii]